MSLAMDFCYSYGSFRFLETITYGTPHGGYPVTLLDGVIQESVPVLKLQVEQNLTEFTSGDVSLVCANDDGWWDSTLGSDSPYIDPTQRYPDCCYINVYQDNALVFQGDVDLKTVRFDRRAQTCAFTALGALNRLSQYSAEGIRRATPSYSTYGYMTDSGLTGGVPYFSDSGKSWQLSGPDNVIGCCLLSAGIVWTITGSTGATYNVKLLLANPRCAPPSWGATPPSYPVLGAYAILPMVMISRYEWNSLYNNRYVLYNNAYYANVISGNGSISGISHPYVLDAGKSWDVSANHGLGQWAGYTLWDSNGVAWLIEGNDIVSDYGLTNGYQRLILSRSLSGAPTFAVDIHGNATATLYTIRKPDTYYIPIPGPGNTPPTIVIAGGSGAPTLQDAGRTGVANLEWPSGSVPQFGLVGWVCIDGAGQPWVITASTQDTLSFAPNGSLVPDGSSYRIVWGGSLNMIESLGQSISALALLGTSIDSTTHNTVGGDTISLTSSSGPIGSVSLSSVSPNYPIARYEASTQQAVIQFAATPTTDSLGVAAGLPALSAQQLWLTEAIKADVDAGSGIALATPYYRDTGGPTSPTLLSEPNLAALFVTCGIANYVISVPTFDQSQSIPYADFKGKSCMDALAEVASICGCVLYTTFSGDPTAPVVTYNFQPREVGVGTAVDLSAPGVILEKSDGISHEWYYPCIEVKGASKTSVRRGSSRPGSNTLTVSSDYVDSYLWLTQLADRLWSFFGARRATATIKVLAEALPNGTVGLLSPVSLNGTDTWWVMSVSRPLLEPCDAVDLELISAVGTVYTPSDFEIEDLDADPEPPTITVAKAIRGTYSGSISYDLNDAVYSSGNIFLSLVASNYGHSPLSSPAQWANLGNGDIYTYVIAFTWAFPDQALLGFQRHNWGPMNGRQTGAVGFLSPGTGITVIAGTFWAVFAGVLPGEFYVDMQTVLVDGRTSPPSDAVLV